MHEVNITTNKDRSVQDKSIMRWIGRIPNPLWQAGSQNVIFIPQNNGCSNKIIIEIIARLGLKEKSFRGSQFRIFFNLEKNS